MGILDNLLGIAIVCDKCGLFRNRFFDNYESTYSTRLTFVKLIYLFQSLTGLSLGYNFVWHIDGPYSRTVNRIGYVFQQEGKSYGDNIEINKVKFLEASINRIVEKFSTEIQSLLSSPMDMEIAASLQYINHRNPIRLVNELIERKPKFLGKEKRIRQVITKLRNIKTAISS